MAAFVALKKEKSQKLVQRIADEHSHETLAETIKRRKLEYLVPEDFLCPLSGEIMGDAVQLCNGKTFDRPYIKKWLEDNYTCPQTKEVLEHTLETPNEIVRKLISEWYNKFCPPDPVPYCQNEDIARDRFNFLLEKTASASIPDQKAAAKEFRLISYQVGSIRAFFGESSDNITRLLSPLSLGNASSDNDLHEDLIKTVLNVSIPDVNKELVAEHFVARPLLIESLESGSFTARTYAAAAILSLLDIESNQHLFGSAHVIKPLINLLEVVDQVNKDIVGVVATMLFLAPENRTRAVDDGAVSLLLSKIDLRTPGDVLYKSPDDLYEYLNILSYLTGEEDTFVQMFELRGIAALYTVLFDSNREDVDELCMYILYAMYFSEERYQKSIARWEFRFRSIGRLAMLWIVDDTARHFADNLYSHFYPNFRALSNENKWSIVFRGSTQVRALCYP